jgi:hypothetical protein
VAHSSVTPIPSDSGSVSPTLVASLPGSPPDDSLSVHYSLLTEVSDPFAPLASATTSAVSEEHLSAVGLDIDLSLALDGRRKRRRIEPDYLIDVAHPHTRPLKVPRQSVEDPAPDHDLRPMRYNGNVHEPGPSGSTAAVSNGDSSNGVDGFATNGHSTAKSSSSSSPSSVALVKPTWTTLYKDSQHDREQVVRTVLQALRDVGYT